jgi:hypothetical protein
MNTIKSQFQIDKDINVDVLTSENSKYHHISIYDDLKGKDIIFQCNTKELRRLADFLYKIVDQK